MDASRDNLRGRTALVTGGARRIGAAIAVGLARSGVNVVVHYNKSGEQAAALVARLEDLGVRAWAVGGDFEQTGSAEVVFSKAASKAGQIDILINNASSYEADTAWQVSEGSLGRNMNVHALSPLVLARLLAGQTDSGRVVNLLDTRTSIYDRQHVSYHISKRTLLMLTRMLAMELAPKITVNGVAPGIILPPEGEGDDYLERMANTNPMGGHGDCEDVVEAVMFLLRSGFVTGQIIYVDGGAHMRGHMYD